METTTDKKRAKKINPAHRIANLYMAWTVNGLYELALSISQDFSLRPNRYSNCVASANQLYNIATSAGKSPAWPTRDIRAALLGAIFGSSHQRPNIQDRSHFRVFGNRLRDSSYQLSMSSTKDAYRSEFVASAQQLRDYLKSFEVPAVDSYYDLLWNTFVNCANLLKHKEIHTVFGVNEVIPDIWPLEFSQAACKLIGNASGEIPHLRLRRFTENEFASIHRVSLVGRDVLNMLLNDNLFARTQEHDDSLMDLCSKCIQWKSAIETVSRSGNF